MNPCAGNVSVCVDMFDVMLTVRFVNTFYIRVWGLSAHV